MKKKYFTEDYLRFFMDLASNNNKDWFDANKKRFIEHVKQPFEACVEDIIALARKKEGLGDIKASDCVFRIYKDVRFSKDKTPYKLQMSALIGKGGRKNMNAKAIYIEFGPEFMQIYSGVYMPEKEQLLAIRHKIAKHLKEFNSIINDKTFKKVYGEIKGEKAKLLPPELKEKAKEQNLILNKQFYVVHQCDAEQILKPGLPEYILEKYEAAEALNSFLFS